MVEDKLSATITRRDFIRGTAYGTLGAALGLSTRPSQAAGEKAAKVVLIRDKRALGPAPHYKAKSEVISAMLDQAIAALTGEKDRKAAWAQFIKPDDIVGIKTNVMLTLTRPEVDRTVAARVRQAGVPENKVILDDRGVQVTMEACTALINTCQLKSHWLSGMAGCIKNYIMFDPKPLGRHPDSCASLGQVWHYPLVKGKTRLIVMDLLHPLFHGGPQLNPMYRWPYCGLMVSTDPVAVDTVCLKILQAKRDAFKGEPWPLNPPPKHIALADTEYHLGCSDLSKIEIVEVGGKSALRST